MIKCICADGCGEIETKDMIKANTVSGYDDDDNSLVCPKCNCDVWYLEPKEEKNDEIV